MIIPGYSGNLSWLGARTIFLTRHGSHAYGTSTPSSDLDLKGVAIPPARYALGFASRFEQAEVKEPDAVIYELRKFFTLAADCNPSVIEVLFTDPDDHLGVSALGARLVEARRSLLSRKARHTFSGYAMAQLRRLQQHHRWIKDPPASPPPRADLGLPDEDPATRDAVNTALGELEKEVRGWEVDFGSLDRESQDALRERIAAALAARVGAERAPWPAAARALGLGPELTERLALEREHRAKVRAWEQFQQWRRARNAKRAELESRFGYDVKFGMHVVRLLRMAREVLVEGEVRVRRPDADELLAIRAGAWPFERLVSWATEADAALDGLAKTSPLPHAPDRAALDALCVSLFEEALRQGDGPLS